MERGLEGDPLNLLYRVLYARGLRLAGRLEDAGAELRSILEMDENYSMALGLLGSVCAQQERYEEALAFTEKAHALIPWSSLITGQLAAILDRTGAAARAQAPVETLNPETAICASTGRAVFHALRGDHKQAGEWAARAIKERELQVVQNLSPFLRATTFWPSLIRLMNLPG
jgi:tetratricopeptide (TPR) repeat protein